MSPTTVRTMVRPSHLAFTPDEEAQRLIAQDSVAFIVGFVLDQQVQIQLAFHSPLELKRRLGHLDAARIATMPLDDLVEVFSQKPALHRFPGRMAERVRDCMTFLCERYDGNADRIWLEATDTADLHRRIGELPGFGSLKQLAVTAILARHFHLDFPGWDAELPPYGALAYVDSLEDLAAYQQRKREYKKALRSSKQ